ncbi:MAG: CotH kinase family protein [Bryobacterales bacterium]|nr:CotH kinase family protein [Bryobacterales bacterium]
MCVTLRGLALAVVAAAAVGGSDPAAVFFDDSKVGEIRLYFDDPNWYNTLFRAHANDPNDPYFPARFRYGDIEIPKIGARFKGHSSFQRNGVKKPFKLDFNEYDANASFLGLKKLNLHNGDLQPDFMREKLFLEFAGRHVCAMRAAHVRLYVNDAYYGLYLAVEQPDRQMMRRCFGQDEDGNLFEAGENAPANMSYLGPDPAAYYRAYELKTNEAANDYSGLIRLLNVLNNTPAGELPARLEPLMDVENVLKGMALNALFTNLESYLGSAAEYFLYQRSRDNRFVHIHWDTNETFGTTGDGTPRLADPMRMDPFWLPSSGAMGPGMPGAPGGGAAANSRPLLEKLWAVPAYRRYYVRVLAQFLREGFDEPTFAARIREIADRIRPHLAEDPNKPFTMQQFETALHSQLNVSAGMAGPLTLYGLTQFVRERRAYLRSLLDGMAEPSDVRLNEIAAVNGGSPRDEAGEADPWVELYNLGPGPVSTEGFYLSDDPANPTKWALPARRLADGEHLLLWLDGEPWEGETHANFRLGPTGGRLYLFARQVSLQTPLDTVTYPALAAGQSYARVGSWGSEWAVTSAATPGAGNVIVAASGTMPRASTGNGRLLINEFMADNDGAFEDPDEKGAYEDWFEIYNPGPAPVNMGGMYITDNPRNPTKWRVPEGVVIPAGGHLVFIADGETGQGPLHTSWSLSADGESISLYEPDGQTLIDSVTFGPQRTDVAMGRTSDGAPSWSLFVPGTPGKANRDPLANWILNAASYELGPLAPESIASVFAAGIATTTVTAQQTSLATELAGVTVTLTDSKGTRHAAALYFVSPEQLNFLVPGGIAAGKARVEIRRPDGSLLSADTLIDAAAPGLFSADSTGKGLGVMAAVSGAGTSQTWTPVYEYDAGARKFAAKPVKLSPSGPEVYLVLYGTGIRHAKAADLTATVGGVGVPIAYAGPQGQYAGVDQVNLGPLPASLAGKGEVSVVVAAGRFKSNAVTLVIE